MSPEYLDQDGHAIYDIAFQHGFKAGAEAAEKALREAGLLRQRAPQVLVRDVIRDEAGRIAQVIEYPEVPVRPRASASGA